MTTGFFGLWQNSCNKILKFFRRTYATGSTISSLLLLPRLSTVAKPGKDLGRSLLEWCIQMRGIHHQQHLGLGGSAQRCSTGSDGQRLNHAVSAKCHTSVLSKNIIRTSEGRCGSVVQRRGLLPCSLGNASKRAVGSWAGSRDVNDTQVVCALYIGLSLYVQCSSALNSLLGFRSGGKHNSLSCLHSFSYSMQASAGPGPAEQRAVSPSWMQPKVTLSVEGNISVGKSTFLNHLQSSSALDGKLQVCKVKVCIMCPQARAGLHIPQKCTSRNTPHRMHETTLCLLASAVC